ncbi:uncharacterized protein LOC110465274 [Mizuhopecten yessoensis]|uniref:uncharacterized protein LOC110465274 n=1 Tax=Mizuhopecten yessoensis TaxID=6573 RepID=UPI000B45BAF8|nr:uncharacterized protein LOC110465274 [Mizuhopecten yessoensis]
MRAEGLVLRQPAQLPVPSGAFTQPTAAAGSAEQTDADMFQRGNQEEQPMFLAQANNASLLQSSAPTVSAQYEVTPQLPVAGQGPSHLSAAARPDSASASFLVEQAMNNITGPTVSYGGSAYGQAPNTTGGQSVTYLNAKVLELVNSALTPSSQQMYHRAFVSLSRFAQSVLHTECCLPIDVNTLVMFIAYLSKLRFLSPSCDSHRITIGYCTMTTCILGQCVVTCSVYMFVLYVVL